MLDYSPPLLLASVPPSLLSDALPIGLTLTPTSSDRYQAILDYSPLLLLANVPPSLLSDALSIGSTLTPTSSDRYYFL